MNNLIPGLVVVFLMFTSCKKNPISSSQTNPAPVNTYSIKQIDFTYFTAKAKVNFQDKNNNLNATVNLRIRKDSVIWISLIPALGIEATRCLVTKDSVFLLDRLNNHYYQYDFTGLEKKIHTKLSYALLEAIIIGNLPFEKTGADTVTLSSDQLYHLLTQQRGRNSIENSIKISSSKIERIHVTDPADSKELNVVYSNFAPAGIHLFPNTSMVNLTFNNNKTIANTLLSIQYSKVDFVATPLNFPFNIPAKFTRD